MKITPNFAFKQQTRITRPNFGHIYSNAVDVFRYASENYERRYEYNIRDYNYENPKLKEYYVIERDSKETKLSDEEVSKLKELVERASKLKKTIVSRYQRSQMSICLLDNRSTVIKNPDTKQEIKVEFKKEDPKYNLEQFEKLVQYAQKLEETDLEEKDRPRPCSSGEKKFERIDKDRAQERFRDIYDRTYFYY